MLTATADKTAALSGLRTGSFVLIAFVVFAASLFGILTRPVGFLAALWPANAILLGLMVRWPRLATLPNWIAAFLGYVAADLATGGSLHITLWLTAANMVGVMTGFLLFQMATEDDRRLQRPLSVLVLMMVCVSAAAAAAIVGCGAARILFGRDFLSGIEFWFTTELVNMLVILPVLLALPDAPAAALRQSWSSISHGNALRAAGPVAALALSSIAAVAVGGPGAIAFTVPALVWCALNYSVFVTAVLTMLLCSALMILSSTGLLALPMSSDLIDSTNSLRLGIALIAIGPLSVSCINGAREQLLKRLAQAANEDALTGILSRRAFMEQGYETVAKLSASGASGALLMLDLDHFKSVNDAHGHAGGDAVLVEFAKLVSGALGPDDLFGRLGGEEFGVLLPRAGLTEAVRIAERIRHTVKRSPVRLPSGKTVDMSVSIGVSVIDGVSGACLEKLMATSDTALYDAKRAGRNTVQAAA